MANYCIGDIQGCYRKLQQLLELIEFSLQSDKLWFVGDLVNRGPNSALVLRFIKELPEKNRIVVLGNHDFHLLAIYYGVIHPARHTLEDVLTAKDRGDLVDWLRCQLLMHHDAKLGYTLAHAGIYPLWDIPSAQKYSDEVIAVLRKSDCKLLFQIMYGDKPNIWSEELRDEERWRFIINSFTRMRFCDEEGRLDFTCDGKIDTAPKGYVPWFKVAKRKTKGKKIVFGHWAALEGETDEPNVFALDTGCVWGNALTAMRLEDGKMFRVSCGVGV